MSVVSQVILLAQAIGTRIKTLTTTVNGKLDVGGAINAAQITSGMIDIARIPALKSDNTVIASGDITTITAPQQADIVIGTEVITSDGRSFRYSGTGSKTLEASYIFIADRTPEWSVVANKPTTVAGYAITDVYTKTDVGDPATDFVAAFNTASV